MKSENISQNAFRHREGGNSLWNYVRSLSPDAIAQLSQPESQEVFGIIEQNITGLLGNLPQDNFDVSISTNRESLGRLLASAMMSGYFLRNVEQRMGLEESLSNMKPDS